MSDAVALVVALVALIVALGQLLGQYFSTADGYRRCQPSVMGPWARYTRLRWRWSQFRFETFFTTPQILLMPEGHDSKPLVSPGLVGPMSPAQKPLKICDGENAYQSIRELFILEQDSKKDEYLVCWLSLLQSIYLNRRELERYRYFGRLVAFINVVLVQLSLYDGTKSLHWSG